MIRAEAETCFLENKIKITHVTFVFDDYQLSAHKGSKTPKIQNGVTEVIVTEEEYSDETSNPNSWVAVTTDRDYS